MFDISDRVEIVDVVDNIDVIDPVDPVDAIESSEKSPSRSFSQPFVLRCVSFVSEGAWCQLPFKRPV